MKTSIEALRRRRQRIVLAACYLKRRDGT